MRTISIKLTEEIILHRYVDFSKLIFDKSHYNAPPLINVQVSAAKKTGGVVITTKHVVLTPVRNEEEFLSKSIISMLNQTCKPDLWIIVDDSSDDSSMEIAREKTNNFPWIKIIHSEIPGKRRRGERVARLVNLALGKVDLEWNFLSKIDADIVLPPDYFEKIFSKFQENERLGIASGLCYTENSFGRFQEKVSPDHTRGALKTYSKRCFRDIGGIKIVNGWDGIDNIEAQMAGWETKNFPDIKSLHLRRTGTAGGRLYSCYENGKTAYFMGYHPLFMFLRSSHRMFSFPHIVGGVWMFIGYFISYLKNLPTYDNHEVVKYLRDRQLSRIGIHRTKKN